MRSTGIVRGLRVASLVGALTAALVSGGATGPAAAASGDVLVSADGVHFSPALAGGLFAGLGQLIPGDSVSADLWIRNPTPAPAELRVSARDVRTSSDALADGVTMSAWDSGTDATRSAALSALASCEVLAPSQSVGPGETIRMVFTFTMDDLSGGVAQRESANLGLMVAMRDAEAGPFPSSACEDDGVFISSTPARTGTLSRTGTDIALPVLMAGGLLVGVGVFLVAFRRRRELDES